MIKNLVDALRDTAEKIEGIEFFRYSGADKINAQNNNETIQVWVEDDIFIQYLVEKDICKATINIDILDKKYQGDKSLDIHDNTMKVAIVLMKLIDFLYPGELSVYDYSLMTLSDYTDDELYGTRLTLYVLLPSPIDECNIDEYIDDLKEWKVQQDKELDVKVPKIDISTININPTKVFKNKNGKR